MRVTGRLEQRRRVSSKDARMFWTPCSGAQWCLPVGVHSGLGVSSGSGCGVGGQETLGPGGPPELGLGVLGFSSTTERAFWRLIVSSSWST